MSIQPHCSNCQNFTGIDEPQTYFNPGYYEWECQISIDKLIENTPILEGGLKDDLPTSPAGKKQRMWCEEVNDYAPWCNLYQKKSSAKIQDKNPNVYELNADLYSE